ncbi:hypothetical protein QE369_000661 [Agrobacterium larrymoorei]|uniref:DNA-binding protein n=1 Tax=Agrobacterium larrymoorei TaxID=160699 RepID=A0AAJ2B518_9HYPH|nr:hypothetical protein [Agrobacterium larrymoorei]MDR6100483.1 hypothetical protein [Agrobacterium larrymoorei]
MVEKMTDQFEFELVFALPGRDFDPSELSNAVFEAGFEDSLVGTGVPGLLGVELEADGEDAESAILASARALLKHLPAGTQLREVRPDLVSLADVAEKLNVKRQALQQREMPLPSVGGLYRIDELATALEKATKPEEGKRRPRFDIANALKWLKAGYGARRINAKLTIHEIDAVSLDIIQRENFDELKHAG